MGHNMENIKKKGAGVNTDTWMFKKSPEHRAHRTLVDEFISGLSRRIGIETTQESFAGRIGNEFGSFNKWFKFVDTEKKDWSLRSYINKYGTGFASHLPKKQLISIVREQVLDWLTSNHDSHSGHFLINPSGEIVTIDKSQAFKYIGQKDEKLSTEYDPNAKFNGKNNRYYMPVYNMVMATIAKGEAKLSLSEVRKEAEAVIEKINGISPEEYIKELLPYAIFRFDAINSQEDAQSGLTRYHFLDLATKRLLSVKKDFKEFYDTLENNYTQTKASNTNSKNLGGIDLNPDILNMNVKGESSELNNITFNNINLNLDIDGFLPVIIGIASINNLGSLFDSLMNESKDSLKNTR